MKRLSTAAAFAVLLRALLPAPSAAQSAPPAAAQCAPHESVVAQLADRFGESRQAMGLAPNNALVELFANPETGTWTITGTLPSGVTCMIASGDAYEPVAESLIPGQGA